MYFHIFTTYISGALTRVVKWQRYANKNEIGVHSMYNISRVDAVPSQIAKFIGPVQGSCRPQVGPMLAP